MDFWKTEDDYFCVEGWTGEIRLKRLGKIGFWRQLISTLHFRRPQVLEE